MTEILDTAFVPPKRFIPIDEAAMDGKRQLLKRGADYAVGQWSGDFWSYPYGPGKFEGDCAVQIAFAPTHYAPRRLSAP